MEWDRDADIQIAGFSMWVDGYQYPSSVDYWDGNWVRVRVVCTGEQATVKLMDACVHLPELAAWLDECVKLQAGQADHATLPTMEPYLWATIDHSGGYKGLLATIKLTPDNVSQFHEFRFPIDLTYLARLIQSLRVILARLPIRGKP
ncbi:MAG TPA: hypothetical protein VD997_08315 [Phycisphaerales bacterium]|nr:hypothetical protein [Phycisphaerales bacterium]